MNKNNLFQRGLGYTTLYILLLLAVSLILPLKLIFAQDIQLYATLQVSDEVASGQPVNLTFDLTNQTDQELYVLSWYTPLEGIAGDIFVVERDGEPVQYHGLLAKRATPTEDQYVSIKPGGSIKAEVDLAGSYDLTKPGNYTIRFIAPSVSDISTKAGKIAKSTKDLAPLDIRSEPVTLEITGPEVMMESDVTVEVAPKEPAFTSCTDSQKETISVANGSAELATAFSYSYLNNLSSDKRKTDSLYITWFGTYTDSRYSTVLGKFNTINTTFVNQTVTYNCSGKGCASNWYAYVYPGGALEVFLCPVFWNAPDSGTDTKYGTIVHEISHEVASTKDHTYGQTNCQNLAKNDPGKAIENADNYEYFAEANKITIGPEHIVISLVLLLAFILVKIYRRNRTSPKSSLRA